MAREMFQEVKAVATRTEDLSLIPRTHEVKEKNRTPRGFPLVATYAPWPIPFTFSKTREIRERRERKEEGEKERAKKGQMEQDGFVFLSSASQA